VTLHSLRDGLRDAPWLLVHYLWISVEPLGHAASYHVAPPGLVAWALSLAAVAVAGVLAWRWQRTVGAGLAWFALSLVPVLHLVPLWADLADRFALFPSVGLALALAAVLTPLTRRLATVALAATVAFYSVASFVEARPWQSDSLLWRYAVDRQPDAPLARSNLAAVLMGEGRVDEAGEQLAALHALGYTRADVELKRAYVLQRLGHRDEAARAVAAALQLDPSVGAAHALAGQIALAGGNGAEATRELLVARRHEPAHPSVGLLGYLILRARGDAGIGADDPRIDYLRAMQALSFDDAAEAATAARSCLRTSPARAQCEAALAIALTLQAPLTSETRALLDHAIATLPEGPDRQRCKEALWGAR
jgi:tetratricopeptide (TPR) repeat protein